MWPLTADRWPLRARPRYPVDHVQVARRSDFDTPELGIEHEGSLGPNFRRAGGHGWLPHREAHAAGHQQIDEAVEDGEADELAGDRWGGGVGPRLDGGEVGHVVVVAQGQAEA